MSSEILRQLQASHAPRLLGVGTASRILSIFILSFEVARCKSYGPIPITLDQQANSTVPPGSTVTVRDVVATKNGGLSRTLCSQWLRPTSRLGSDSSPKRGLHTSKLLGAEIKTSYFKLLDLQVSETV